MTGRFIFHPQTWTFSIEGYFIAQDRKEVRDESPDVEDDPIPQEWRNHVRDIMR